MDLITAIVTVAGPAVGKMLQDVWGDYRAGRNARLGIAINTLGYQTKVPTISGVPSIPSLNTSQTTAGREYPVLLSGGFVASQSFAEFADLILEEEEKQVVILVYDEEYDYTYLFEFGFDEFAINLMPGLYSLYAFIVDPILDDVMAFGYPYSPAMSDPNPLRVSGRGAVEMDFLLFDEADLE